jgi:hypothetical protein
MPYCYSFTLEYGIRKVQENQVGLKLNGTQQLLVSAVDVNLLRDDIDTIKKNTGTLIDASRVGWSRSKPRENKVYASSPECRAKS